MTLQDPLTIKIIDILLKRIKTKHLKLKRTNLFFNILIFLNKWQEKKIWIFLHYISTSVF